MYDGVQNGREKHMTNRCYYKEDDDSMVGFVHHADRNDESRNDTSRKSNGKVLATLRYVSTQTIGFASARRQLEPPLDWHSASTSGIFTIFTSGPERGRERTAGFGFHDRKEAGVFGREGRRERFAASRDTGDSRNRVTKFPIQFGCTRSALVPVVRQLFV